MSLVKYNYIFYINIYGMKTPLKNVKNTKYLLGWTNIKWFLREMVLIYSSKKSFFLKKNGIRYWFCNCGWGMIFF
jgi:hypothetical protein